MISSTLAPGEIFEQQMSRCIAFIDLSKPFKKYRQTHLQSRSVDSQIEQDSMEQQSADIAHQTKVIPGMNP